MPEIEKEREGSFRRHASNTLVDSIKLEALKIPTSFNLSTRNLMIIPGEIVLLYNLDRYVSERNHGDCADFKIADFRMRRL